MGLKETISSMKKLLADISKDLDKSLKGNRAASQRVRVNSIRLDRVSKLYRKESVASEKKSGGKTKGAVAKKTAAKKATAKILKKKK